MNLTEEEIKHKLLWCNEKWMLVSRIEGTAVPGNMFGCFRYHVLAYHEEEYISLIKTMKKFNSEPDHPLYMKTQIVANPYLNEQNNKPDDQSTLNEG